MKNFKKFNDFIFSLLIIFNYKHTMKKDNIRNASTSHKIARNLR